MRQAISFVRPVLGHDPRRTRNIECLIYATNFGASLFRERDTHRVIFLKNETTMPFLTGDQPVINMFSPAKTNNVELYYPVSPTLAVVLTKDAQKFPYHRRVLSKIEVENYNYAMFRKSEDQVYSNDEAYLRSVVSMGKHFLSP